MPPKNNAKQSSVLDIFHNRFVKIVAIVVGVGTLSSMVWAASDYLEVRPITKKEFAAFVETQKQLSENVLLLRFQQLFQKSEFSALTFQERQEMCRIAKQLDYVGVPGCGAVPLD